MNRNIVSYTSGAVLMGLAGAALYRRSSRPPIINVSVPEPTKPVALGRYLGRWYEVARHENSFERGLEAVTADYWLRPDGKIAVANGGRKGGPKGPRKTVRGRAIIVDDATTAKFKVSFFGPFYVGDYWVLDHGDDYQWAIVGEPEGRYVWILSRGPEPSNEEMEFLLQRAEMLGYDLSRIRRTVQN